MKTSFTGHKNAAIHLKMLAHDHPFDDTVQMPLNCFDGPIAASSNRCCRRFSGAARHRRFGHEEQGGDGQPILHGAVSAEEALRYAMSLPVATTISGIDSLGVLRQNLTIARGFKPMAPEEMQALRQRCKSFAADGHLERRASSADDQRGLLSSRRKSLDPLLVRADSRGRRRTPWYPA